MESAIFGKTSPSETQSSAVAHPDSGSQGCSVYEGVVRHRRRDSAFQSFAYRVTHLLLDLHDSDLELPDRRVWSARVGDRPELRRSDYLGSWELPLRQAVRECVARAIGTPPDGPVKLLTHARYPGDPTNPVNFYFCYEADGPELNSIVAEITNAWNEHHCYVLPLRTAAVRGRRMTWSSDRSIDVSEFAPRELQYNWTSSAPGNFLYVRMDVLRAERHEFDATLALRKSQRLGYGR